MIPTLKFQSGSLPCLANILADTELYMFWVLRRRPSMSKMTWVTGVYGYGGRLKSSGLKIKIHALFNLVNNVLPRSYLYFRKQKVSELKQ